MEEKLIKNSKIFVGKRKNSVARIFLREKENNLLIVNNKKVSEYFPHDLLVKRVYLPFEVLNIKNHKEFFCNVQGGGFSSQASAISLALSKYLVTLNEENRHKLKEFKLLTRDSRKKERKKYGLKKARKAPQFSKR
ncbi:30S ribosomal protein S9 [symbiont of Argiope bruennichi]|uniref:30S ribosomal protein S9 n=1 Tax=symbiont of Argiope bruennichi TaxID=2810479 RepID=UPI003DA68B2E